MFNLNNLILEKLDKSEKLKDILNFIENDIYENPERLVSVSPEFIKRG